MTATGIVDLYAFRCAVAALVARPPPHRPARRRRSIARIDLAVGHLVDVVDDLHGDLAAATGWLLSPEPDPGGRRTVRAIDRLAALTHVDPAAAPALAASLRGATRPFQPTLFDESPPAEATA